MKRPPAAEEDEVFFIDVKMWIGAFFSFFLLVFFPSGEKRTLLEGRMTVLILRDKGKKMGRALCVFYVGWRCRVVVLFLCQKFSSLKKQRKGKADFFFLSFFFSADEALDPARVEKVRRGLHAAEGRRERRRARGRRRQARR